MAYLEIGSFCSIEEYNTYRCKRVMETDIEQGGLYTYMMRFDHAEKQAAKQPVRAEEIIRKAGKLSVRFAFLNEDLEPECVVEESVWDGIIACCVEVTFNSHETGDSYQLQEAYLRDYYEDQFGDMLTRSNELSLA